VLVEKPAGAKPRRSRVPLHWRAVPAPQGAVAENFYYRDDLLFARSLIQAGKIGQVHLLHWRIVNRSDPRRVAMPGTRCARRPLSGRFHLDGGVHHVAEMRLLLGEIVSVQAFTRMQIPNGRAERYRAQSQVRKRRDRQLHGCLLTYCRARRRATMAIRPPSRMRPAWRPFLVHGKGSRAAV